MVCASVASVSQGICCARNPATRRETNANILNEVGRHLRDDGSPPGMRSVPDSHVDQELLKWGALASLIISNTYPRREETCALCGLCIFVPFDQTIDGGVPIVRILKVIPKKISAHETRAHTDGAASSCRYSTEETGVEPMRIDFECRCIALR